MKKEIQIVNRKIGQNFEPVVIAEIGINHNGSLEVAIKMVDAAILVGAEIIIHQTHKIYKNINCIVKLFFQFKKNLFFKETLVLNSITFE